MKWNSKQNSFETKTGNLLFTLFWAIAFIFILPETGNAQQIADTTFLPTIKTPVHRIPSRPIVGIDEVHNNFHTAFERYLTFSTLLRRDGYRIVRNQQIFTPQTLAALDILVITNALHINNVESWKNPTYSAFSETEIEALVSWVNAGGSLLLIADHMPFPGAVTNLASQFGVHMRNGFAFPDEESLQPPTVFYHSRNQIVSHPITTGAFTGEPIDSIATFTGHAFQIDDPVQGLIRFSKGAIQLEPNEAWQFDERTPQHTINGWYQGAVVEFGKGRVAVFGEAAMFTAQLAGPHRWPMGMNHSSATQNVAFLRNLIAWLSGAPEIYSSASRNRR